MGPIATAVTKSIALGDDDWAFRLPRGPLEDDPWWDTLVSALFTMQPERPAQEQTACAMRRGKIANRETAFRGCYVGPFIGEES